MKWQSILFAGKRNETTGCMEECEKMAAYDPKKSIVIPVSDGSICLARVDLMIIGLIMTLVINWS